MGKGQGKPGQKIGMKGIKIFIVNQRNGCCILMDMGVKFLSQPVPKSFNPVKVEPVVQFKPRQVFNGLMP